MNNYVQLLESTPRPSIVLVTGPSGTGKTYQACKVGQKLVGNGTYKKLVLTRPAVTPSDENHGYIPGDLTEKMGPWVRPALDHLSLHNKLELCPLAFMRGRTFENTWIIADEMQNSTREQMLMLLTRIGFGSKMVIIGDPYQSDLPRGTQSGLDDLMDRLVASDEISHVRLKDIRRHAVISEILGMYSKK